MTEEEALAYLTAAGRFGHLGLDRTVRLLDRLGHPEARMRFYHVAGTNGKGSATASLDAMLRRAGRRTGRFVSPHLVRPHERVAVDGRDIPGDQLASATRAVQEAARGMDDPPTEFELWMAVALVHFLGEGVTDVAWETGLGGTYDATNAVTPEVCMITSIGLDHMDRLGGTLRAIAGEKAGILKPGRPAVVGALAPEALGVVEAAAERAGAPIWRMGRELAVSDVQVAAGGTRFRYRDPLGELHLRSSLVGRHQAYNAALAVAALRRALGKAVDAKVLGALQDVFWPGRFEVRAGTPTVVLDGAHNAQGTQALLETWRAAFPGVQPAALFGCLADRDPREIAGALREELCVLHTVAPPSPRALPARAAAAALRGRPHDSVAQGLAAAARDARRRGVPLLVFGSLYLIGAVEELLGGKAT